MRLSIFYDALRRCRGLQMRAMRRIHLPLSIGACFGGWAPSKALQSPRRTGSGAWQTSPQARELNLLRAGPLTRPQRRVSAHPLPSWGSVFRHCSPIGWLFSSTNAMASSGIPRCRVPRRASDGPRSPEVPANCSHIHDLISRGFPCVGLLCSPGLFSSAYDEFSVS